MRIKKVTINDSDMFNVTVTEDDKYSFKFISKINKKVSTGELVYIR